MTKLKDQIENALNESRTLILGVQVLVGFQYQVVFQNSFEELSPMAELLHLAGVALLLVAMAWLIAPAAFHQIAERGEDTPGVHRFATRAVGAALLPFAAGLALDVYIVCERLAGPLYGVGAALAALMVALAFWYGWGLWDRAGRRPRPKDEAVMKDNAEAPTALGDKIKQVLTETRIVLPGVQAFLGFQLATMFMDGFERLAPALKYVHLAALAAISVSMVLLITPAAYHRLAERGEDSEHFLRLASRLLLAAMVFLALGTAADFYVVVERVAQSTLWGAVSAGLALLLCYGLWFGYTAYHRGRAARPQVPSGR